MFNYLCECEIKVPEVMSPPFLIDFRKKIEVADHKYGINFAALPFYTEAAICTEKQQIHAKN